MLYLPPEHWSPRFDKNFFTVKILSRSLLLSPPVDDTETQAAAQPHLGGRGHYPAIYYHIEIRYAREKHSIFRRFSHFYRLYERIAKGPPPTVNRVPNVTQEYESSDPIKAPRKTCPFTIPTEDFLDSRQQELEDFLRDVLRRPSMVQHPAISVFLELNRLYPVESEGKEVDSK